jgi:hypothetical protein
MFERCGESERVVATMVRKGRLIDACEFARDQGCMGVIDAGKVLGDAYARDDEEKRMFKVCFGFLEAYGLIDAGCGRWVSIMREMGEAIVMESVL